MSVHVSLKGLWRWDLYNYMSLALKV